MPDDFLDHGAEVKRQEEIAAEVAAAESAKPALSQDSVAGETADQPDAASIDTDDAVNVQLTEDADVNYVRIAGVKLEPGKDVEVTRSTALLLGAHDKVEVSE